MWQEKTGRNLPTGTPFVNYPSARKRTQMKVIPPTEDAVNFWNQRGPIIPEFRSVSYG
jgi:hypothetical protein